MILYYFVNAKLKSHVQAYTVSAAGPAEVRSRRAKSRGVFKGGLWCHGPPPLGRQDSIISIE